MAFIVHIILFLLDAFVLGREWVLVNILQTIAIKKYGNFTAVSNERV